MYSPIGLIVAALDPATKTLNSLGNLTPTKYEALHSQESQAAFSKRAVRQMGSTPIFG